MAGTGLAWLRADLAAAVAGDDDDGGAGWDLGVEIGPAGGGFLQGLGLLRRVLDGEEESLAVRGEAGAAHLGVHGRGVHQLRHGAAGAVDLGGIEAVGDAEIGGAVGGDPEAALGIEGDVVGVGEPAVGRNPLAIFGTLVGGLGIAGQEEDIPLELRRRVVGILALARRQQLEDVAGGVLGARIGRGHLLVGALLIFGEHERDAAVHVIGLEILGPVHGGGAQEIAGLAGLQHDVALAVEAVVGRERALSEDERQPIERAVGIEAAGVERAVVEQVLVGGAIGRVDGVAADELVDIFEVVVVAEIDHRAAVLVED